MKMTEAMEKDYSDIIGLPHWEPKRHPRMPMKARAAQFAPFAALSGHDEAIAETGRLTDERPELCGDMLTELNEKLRQVRECIGMAPAVEIAYFAADERKLGGAVKAHSGAVKRIDDYDQAVIFADATSIPLRDILDIRLL